VVTNGPLLTVTNVDGSYNLPSGFWVFDEADLAVDFDDGGTATHVDVHFINPPTFTERIRRWLGL
jgi:hypothetical protein